MSSLGDNRAAFKQATLICKVPDLPLSILIPSYTSRGSSREAIPELGTDSVDSETTPFPGGYAIVAVLPTVCEDISTEPSASVMIVMGDLQNCELVCIDKSNAASSTMK